MNKLSLTAALASTLAAASIGARLNVPGSPVQSTEWSRHPWYGSKLRKQAARFIADRYRAKLTRQYEEKIVAGFNRPTLLPGQRVSIKLRTSGLVENGHIKHYEEKNGTYVIRLDNGGHAERPIEGIQILDEASVQAA